MKSAASEPLAYPGLTRLRHDGRDYVALGIYSDAEMVQAIERARNHVAKARVDYLQTRSAIPARNHGENAT